MALDYVRTLHRLQTPWPTSEDGCPNRRCTEWRPHEAVRQFGSHRGASIGVLSVRPLDRTMTTTDIYGFEHDDLDAARVALEGALGFRLQGHYSTYLAEYFHGSISSGPSLQLRRNLDPMHD